MKWIKYQIVCNTVNTGTEEEPNYEDVLIDKKVGYSEANLTIAQNEAYNGEYEIIEDEKSFDKKPIPVEYGGTGANNAKDARTNLEITPDNIGAAKASHTHSYLPLSGGKMTGAVTMKGITLTSGVDYGTSLPSTGTTGRLFFKVVG